MLRHQTQYLLAYFAVAFSGIAYFSDQNWTFALLFLLLSFLFFRGKKSFDKELLPLLILLIIVMILQGLIWGFFPLFILKFIGIFVLIPYMLIKIMGYKLYSAVVDIMVVLALISLFFWVAVNLSEGFHQELRRLALELGTHPGDFTNPLLGEPEQLIVYTFEAQSVFGIVRNPGQFHEPGAFAVFLILALNLNISAVGRILTTKNIILIIAILSTFSTAGYTALFAILTFFSLSKRKIGPVVKFAVIFLFALLSIWTFLNTEFLGDKVFDQYTVASSQDLNTATSGRFLGSAKAFYVLERYPLHGRGLISQNMEKNLNSPEAFGYGFPAFMAQIGIPLALLFTFYFIRGFSRIIKVNGSPKSFIFAVISSLAIVLFAQATTQSILFFSIFFLGLLRENITERKISI